MRKARVVVVVPARMAASRFPGKPLVKILDLPMIEHVRRRIQLSDIVEDVYVATCDQEIMNVVQKYGGKAIMTANTHERCTERVEEAARQIEADIVVIAQGDEPLFAPEVIEKLVAPIIKDNNIYCTNLLSVIRDREDLKDIDIVKTVINMNNEILYYSRSPLPYFRVDNKANCYRQTGISAFTKDFLSTFTSLPATPLEIAESIDFLRILEHGYRIKGITIEQQTFGVDREHDVEIVEEIIQNDPAQKSIYERIYRR
ncbi:MAG: 3-deoxy-manno-octulosonate cytidylyltransferase [Candidatus Margulisiibacteriota bacterium]